MQQNQDQQQDNLELQHINGFSGQNYKTLHFHPRLNNLFIYCIGSFIVIEDLNDRNKQEFLRGHDMPITALTISQSGRYVLSGQMGTIHQKLPDAHVMFWDLSTMSLINLFKGLQYSVTNVSISPDEKFIAATGQNNVLIIWLVSDLTIVTQKVYEQTISQITWDKVSQNGKYSAYTLITTLGPQILINILQFDVKSMQYTLQSFPVQYPASGLQRVFTNSIIFGDELIIGSSTGDLSIFNIPNRVFKALIPIANQGVNVLLQQNGSIFVGTGEGKLKKIVGSQTKWNLDSELQLQGSIMSISESSDKKEMLVGTSFGKIYRVLTANLDAMLVSESHTSKINDICLQPQSFDIMSSIDDQGQVFVWDANEINIITQCIPPSQNNSYNKIKGICCTFSEDDGIVTGWEDGFIRCFNITKQQFSPLRWEIVNAHRGNVTSIYCDVNYILSGGEDAQVRVWSRKTRQLIKQISSHSKAVPKVMPDIEKSHIIHSCSLDKTVHSFDLKLDKKIILHQAKNGVILDMTQRKDKELELITCGQNIPILFWDCDVVEPVDKLDYPYKLSCLEVSPTGKYLALGTEMGEILVFDISNVKFMGKYIGHSRQVSKVRWTFDEKQVLSVSEDGSMCIWNYFE